MRLLTTGERRWGRGTKDSGDSTVPRDPTGRAYCTEVAVGLDRGLCWDVWGAGGGGQRRTEDTSASEVPLVLTVQFTQRPRWGASGRWREQDGGTGWESQILFTDFFFERVSCSPRWPPTGYLGKDDLELLPSLLPRAGTQSSCCWVSSAHPPAAPPLIYFFFLFWSFHSVAQPSLELATVLLP